MSHASPGLMESAKRLLSTLVSIVSTRLELLANELQEERLRVVQMLLLIFLTLFCFGMGILLLTMLVVVAFWDDHRLAVLGSMGLAFLAFGTLAALWLRSKTQASSRLFSASLAELARDKEQLEPDHE